MTTHVPGLVQALQQKVAGLNWFYGPKPPLVSFKFEEKVLDFK
jgi:hypothetical protein